MRMTSKLLYSAIGRADRTLLTSGVNRQMRNFFAYLRIAFNKVDAHRLKEVGPDRLCAEWIIKNGGAVQFLHQHQITKDYNAMQLSSAPAQMRMVDATDSSIMALGFEHFKGCRAIEHIILHRCKHMENEALEQLTHVKSSLKELQVTDCPNVEESGLLSLKQLNHLKKLTIYGLSYVTDLNPVISQLKNDLPDCEIVTNRN